MASPVDPDALSPAELKALVAELLAKLAELERTVAAQREEIARLKGLKGRPKIKPSGMEQATEPTPPRDGKGRRRRGKVVPLVPVEERVLPATVPPGYFSPPRVAKRNATSCCAAVRTCTAKFAPSTKACTLGLSRAMHHNASGGDNDTDAKEFAVTPIGSPSGRRAVITVTPVAKVPKASRSSRGSIGLLTVVPGLARAQVCTGRRPSAHITRAGCGTRGAPSASR